MTDNHSASPLHPEHDALIRELWRQFAGEALAKSAGGIQQIFHYTSIAGAAGLIESQRIWATNVLFMNDPRELFHTTDQVRAILRKRVQDNPKDQLWVEIEAAVDRALRPVETNEAAIAFTASFTAEYDQPVHWGQYAATGGGIALGFDVAELQEAALKRGSPLLRCDYEVEGPTRLIEETVRVLYDIAGGLPKLIANPDERPEYMRVLLDVIGATMGRLVPIYKPPSLKHEKEWRLVKTVLPDKWRNEVSHRTENGLVKPFTKLDVCPRDESGKAQLLPIRTVTLGPTTNWDLLRRGIASQLQAAGYDLQRVQIVPSKMRLRST